MPPPYPIVPQHLLFNQPFLALDLGNQFGFCRQIGHILRGEKLLVLRQRTVPYNRLLLFGTEDNTYRRVVIGLPFKVIKHLDVHVHLPCILMCQLGGFEVKQNKTFQDLVVEHQVDEKMRNFGADTVLPADK